MPDSPTADRLGVPVEAPFPAKRSPDPVTADEDTLHQELATVADRHNGDLSHAQLVLALFDFADSYAEVYDIERRVEFRTPPDGDGEVPVVVVSDAFEHIAPINFHVDSAEWSSL